MDDGDGGAVVEVGDAPGHLDGPVDEHVGPDLPAAEDAVERPAARELHHQAEVGLLQAHAHQAYDVLRERESERHREKSESIRKFVILSAPCILQIVPQYKKVSTYIIEGQS